MNLDRRDFLRLAHAGMFALPVLAMAQEAKPADPQIKLGLVGCGGRGTWISNLFQAHGGFVFSAVADYFPDRAARAGNALGVPESCRFSGLDSGRRLMDSGVDAVVLQVPPYFFPGLAENALDRGLHIYMAKPVAIDIYGTLQIQRLKSRATAEKKVFLADYQLPRDPVNQEVAKRIQAGALGKIQMIFSSGWAGGNGYQDPPKEKGAASRLKDLVWCNDVALGGDYIVHYDEHILDAVVWAMGKRPVSAMGASAAFRPSVHGDAKDSATVIYQFEDGTLWCHQGILGAYHDWIKAGRLTASFQGTQASGCLSYAGKSYVRGGTRHFPGGVPNPEASVRKNIDDFYQNIVTGDFSNEILSRVIESNFTAVLGREAAARRRETTLDELIRENKRLTPCL